jgi:hypothetical protein
MCQKETFPRSLAIAAPDQTFPELRWSHSIIATIELQGVGGGFQDLSVREPSSSELIGIPNNDKL